MTTEKEKFKEALKKAANDAVLFGITRAARDHSDTQVIGMTTGYKDPERYEAALMAETAISSTAREAARKAAIPFYKAASKAAFKAAAKATAAVLANYEAKMAADDAAYEDYKKKNKMTNQLIK